MANICNSTIRFLEILIDSQNVSSMNSMWQRYLKDSEFVCHKRQSLK